MTPTELRIALERGTELFRHKASGKVYSVDFASSVHLFADGDHADITVIGYPVVKPIRNRGRVWQFLTPKAIEPTPQPSTTQIGGK